MVCTFIAGDLAVAVERQLGLGDVIAAMGIGDESFPSARRSISPDG